MVFVYCVAFRVSISKMSSVTTDDGQGAAGGVTLAVTEDATIKARAAAVTDPP